MLFRLGKTLLAGTLAAYFLFVAFDNITDYQTNFRFVQHVLSMDSIPADTHVTWRAIYRPGIHHIFYWTIILWEFAAGCICGVGTKRLFSALFSKREFEAAKTVPVVGLCLGLLLWSFAFITIGGEWFMMWESSVWNGELAALRMFTVNAFALIFLCLPESDGNGESDTN